MMEYDRLLKRFEDQDAIKETEFPMGTDAKIIQDDPATMTVECLLDLIGTMQASLIRAHRKLIELEADMAAAGIGPKAEKKSSILLPERMQ